MAINVLTLDNAGLTDQCLPNEKSTISPQGPTTPERKVRSVGPCPCFIELHIYLLRKNCNYVIKVAIP